MYQREWIAFAGESWEPRAVKVAAGKVCAIEPEKQSPDEFPIFGKERVARVGNDFELSARDLLGEDPRVRDRNERIELAGDDSTLRFLWTWQRWMRARVPNFARIAFASALLPSMTKSMARSVPTPRFEVRE